VSSPGPGLADQLAVAAVLLLVLLAAYFLMWRGWRTRGRKHDLPELPPVGESAGTPLLSGEGRYFGTTVSGQWLDRVVTRGLGARSEVRLSLTDGGVDVVRPGSSFRIPAAALRGARHELGIAGKVVPPHGLLVVTWEHGDHVLDTGFRLRAPAEHAPWVRTIGTMISRNAA
jgi:hypothetical protein